MIRTQRAALAEAVKRWGRKAAVERMDPKRYGHPFKVGRIMLGMFFEVKGTGRTWDHAFAVAAVAEHHCCNACKPGAPCAERARLEAARDRIADALVEPECCAVCDALGPTLRCTAPDCRRLPVCWFHLAEHARRHGKEAAAACSIGLWLAGGAN